MNVKANNRPQAQTQAQAQKHTRTLHGFSHAVVLETILSHVDVTHDHDGTEHWVWRGLGDSRHAARWTAHVIVRGVVVGRVRNVVQWLVDGPQSVRNLSVLVNACGNEKCVAPGCIELKPIVQPRSHSHGVSLPPNPQTKARLQAMIDRAVSVPGSDEYENLIRLLSGGGSRYAGPDATVGRL